MLSLESMKQDVVKSGGKKEFPKMYWKPVNGDNHIRLMSFKNGENEYPGRVVSIQYGLDKKNLPVIESESSMKVFWEARNADPKYPKDYKGRRPSDKVKPQTKYLFNVVDTDAKEKAVAVWQAPKKVWATIETLINSKQNIFGADGLDLVISYNSVQEKDKAFPTVSYVIYPRSKEESVKLPSDLQDKVFNLYSTEDLRKVGYISEWPPKEGEEAKNGTGPVEGTETDKLK